MDIDRVLLRADEQTLESWVGAPVTRIINALEPGSATPAKLREVLTRGRTAFALLDNPEIRTDLISMMSREDARQLAVLVGVDDGDPYGSLLALAFRRGSRQYRSLLAAFDVDAPESDWEEDNSSDDELFPNYALFKHQRRATREVCKALDELPRRVMLHMPTGSGKTRTAMNVIVEFLRRTEPKVVTWFAYSEELCEQAASEFESAWRHLGNRSVSVVRHWGSNNASLGNLHDGIAVCGAAKMYSGLQRDAQPLLRLADRSGLVVFDEAHQAVAPTYKALLEIMVNRSPHTALLGLTATPGRSWADIEEDERLADFFDRKKVSLEIDGYDSPVDYLIDEGYLANPTFRSLPAPNNGLEERDVVRIEAALEIPESILRKLADDDQRTLLIIAEIEALMRRHTRIIVFATTVSHAHILADVLVARGERAYSVSGDTPREVRRKIVEEFKSADPQPIVLCNFGVFTTGFDAPSTSAALIARPTKSLVLYSQMVGRATRGPKAGGAAHSEIVTVIDTALPGFGSMAEAFANWEDVW